MNSSHFSRYDYIIIWGHGLKFKDEIIKSIEENIDFEIIKIVSHIPKSIKKLVKTVYSYDYAPFHHLRAKTKYLEKTPGEVLFIFIKNNNPCIDFQGKGQFRHEESLTLKSLKKEIRDKYNPRVDNKRTEDHVIHASDNESQTDYILKYLGYKRGLAEIITSYNFVNMPYHLGTCSQIRFTNLSIDKLFCNILLIDNGKTTKKLSCIEQTPHYLGISKDIKYYQKYIDEFQGKELQDYYSSHKFQRLVKNFRYLQEPYQNNYIVVKNIKGKYIIQDGVHRASILKLQKRKEITAAVLC